MHYTTHTFFIMSPIVRTKLRASIYFSLQGSYSKLKAGHEVYYIGLFRSEHVTFLYIQTKTAVSPKQMYRMLWRSAVWRSSILPQSLSPPLSPAPPLPQLLHVPPNVQYFDTIQGELIEEIGKIRRPGRISGNNIRDEPVSSASAEPSNTEE